MNEPTIVARPGSSFEARLIAGMLEASGIEALVSADDAGGNEPQFQLTAGVRVLVARADVPEALKLLEEAETGSRRGLDTVSREPGRSRGPTWRPRRGCGLRAWS